MNKWETTPFKTLEDARNAYLEMSRDPSPIDTGGKYRSFEVKEGPHVYLVAQKIEGGPVLEKVIDIIFGEPVTDTSPTQNKTAGPWERSKFSSLADVEEFYREQFVNFDNVEVLTIQLYRIGNEEHEYALDDTGVWARVIS